MAFTDNFTGASQSLLTDRPGWYFGFGENRLIITATNTLGKVAPVTTSAYNGYYRDDDGSTSPTAGADLLKAGMFVGVLCSGTSEATFNGYCMRQASPTSVRVYKVINGAAGSNLIAGLNITGLADTLGMELRAQVVNGSVNLQVFRQGVQVGSGTDSAASPIGGVPPFTAGRRALLTNTGAADGTGLIDNYQDNYTAGANLTINERVSRFFALQPGGTTATVTFSGGFATVPANVQTRIVDGAGNPLPGFDWATKVPVPAGTTYVGSFADVPKGGPYTIQVRDGAVPGTVTSIVNSVFVGGVVIAWGQSQNQRLNTVGVGGLAATAGMKVFHTTITGDKANPNPTVIREVATQWAQLGSGIVAMANQWHADTGGDPLLIVDCTYGGTSIESWINNVTNISGTEMGWGLWTGVAMTSLAAGDFQATAIYFFQGTSNTSNNGAGYSDNMDVLRDKFLSVLPDQAPLIAVLPHPRSMDGPNTYTLRAIQYAKAISGGTWRLLAWLLDWQMDGDASPHQSTVAAGNPRGGRRIGRGLAKLLANPALDIAGPRPVSARFTDATRAAFDVTFDRDIETPSGATTNLPGHFVSTNSGTSFSLLMTGYSAAIVGPRTLRLSKASGSWPQGTTRYDLLRDEPLSSNFADPDRYVGPEAEMDTNFFSKLITDSSTFDGGRGMPAAPIMGTGLVVQEADAATPSVLDLLITIEGGATHLVQWTINPPAQAI